MRNCMHMKEGSKVKNIVNIEINNRCTIVISLKLQSRQKAKMFQKLKTQTSS
jgi:hypothetical protein